MTSCIDASVRIVTKSSKVGPLLIFSISLAVTRGGQNDDLLPLTYTYTFTLNRFLPLRATQITTLWIHTSGGGGSYIRSMSSIRPICKCRCPPLVVTLLLYRCAEEPATWFPGVSSSGRRPAAAAHSDSSAASSLTGSPARSGPGAASSTGSASRRLLRQEVKYEEPRDVEGPEGWVSCF